MSHPPLFEWPSGAPPKAPKRWRGGYAAVPGTGPEDEACGTCRWCERFSASRSWFKCRLMRSFWTGGRGTDILFRAPACSRWERLDANPNHDGGSKQKRHP